MREANQGVFFPHNSELCPVQTLKQHETLAAAGATNDILKAEFRLYLQEVLLLAS